MCNWCVHCATSQKVTGSIPDGVTGIFGIELHMFWTGFLSIIRSLALYTHSNRYMSYRFCWLLANGIRIHPDLASKQSAVWHIRIAVCTVLDSCPKHVEFYSKNKCERLVHLVYFIIGVYHDARSSECQILLLV